MSTLIERSQHLLRDVRFFTMASCSADGAPWAATLNFVTADGPLRLIWYSMARAIHSQHIRARPHVSGSIFYNDRPALSLLGLDGAQFTGTAREIDEAECRDIHPYYYEHNFPDKTVREKWLLPLDEFYGQGKRRFYELRIGEWWLLDLDGWAENKEDRRIAVPLDSLDPNPGGQQ